MNILIDRTGHARLTDFGLLTILSDPSYQLSSSSDTQGGSSRWMSPELIDPQRFGFANGCPTISSDFYALGMVVYEVISGHKPFHKLTRDVNASAKVLEGDHPPRDADFADILWEMLELCWMTRPSDRPNIEDVLQCLERVSELSRRPPSVDETTTTEEDVDDWNSTTETSGKILHSILSLKLHCLCPLHEYRNVSVR